MLGPVVQNIISLTNSLVQDLLNLTVLTKSIVMIFFAEKLRGLQKFLAIFRQKMEGFCLQYVRNFNDTLKTSLLLNSWAVVIIL